MDAGASSFTCSICLESVSENGERASAKLLCGHKFHLDCIGSAFNVKGAMECPNCRKVENGQWLYAKEPTDETDDENANEVDTEYYNYSEMSYIHGNTDAYFDAALPYYDRNPNPDGPDLVSDPTETLTYAPSESDATRRSRSNSAIGWSSAPAINADAIAWSPESGSTLTTGPNEQIYSNELRVPSPIPGHRFEVTLPPLQSDRNGPLIPSQQHRQEVENPMPNDFHSQDIKYYRFSILPDAD